MPSKTIAAPTPPDQQHRDRILHDLDTTLLVEAAAGTGKTTSMVGRMVALLREGKCRVETLAAVTFTRKSAAELRARFQLALERAAGQAKGPASARLAEALGHVERAFIGTIHSFCGRLLRERPIEAKVDLAFRELDEEEDRLLREAAWDEYVAQLHAANSPLLDELSELDLEIGCLKQAFLTYCTYPDVVEWPAPATPLVGLDRLREQLAEYVRHMDALVPTFPVFRGNDKLMDAYDRIVRLARQADLSRPADVMRLLAEFKSCKVVQKEWPGKKEQATREDERWGDFTANTATPWLGRWYEHRYPTVLKVLKPAVALYNRQRREAGGLNFQDLLMQAAELLRDQPQIRGYFRRRFSHLLVDEFQDTDPIQAQVMLYLTATDTHEQDWRKCRPVQGSLFVVGDPKQSIYRFRRADITTYNAVKAIMEASGGSVVPLTTNFRTICELVDWGNDLFDSELPRPGQQDYEERIRYSPEACRMQVGRPGDAVGDLKGLHVLRVPDQLKNNDEAIEYEAEFVARTIRYALDTGAKVPRPSPSGEASNTRAAPGDFLIVTYNKKHLAIYAQQLGKLGIPHQVTGGTALGQVRELSLLADCLKAAAEPENPVALVAVLRGELFGISDTSLYAFRKAGGTFHYRTDVPPGLAAEHAAALSDAFARLRQYGEWLRRLPPVAALECVSADLGLPMRAAAQPGGNVAAGSLAKALELLRQAQADLHSTADLARYLHELIAENQEFDGLPAQPSDAGAVRLMNLHKVKGLEAPVVFLSAPVGNTKHEPTQHIDRSGDTIRGHLQITIPKGDFHHECVARPVGWEHFATEETKFQEAERLRLMYVAATRAGAQLVIVQRAKNNERNYWIFFEEHQHEHGCPDLPDPGPQTAPAGPEVQVTPEDVTAAVTAVDARWSAVAGPTYATERAKELALTDAPAAPRAAPELSAHERGAAWGTVIHLLLQIRMSQPQANLHELARAALKQNDLDPALADRAVETADRVVKSAIWQRAQAASHRLVEVPFSKLLPSESKWAIGGLPTLVRGVIDLVFRDASGWVIVDYKTDAAAATELGKLVDHYRPQVEMYGELWQEMCGEPVVERGLYFTAVDTYKML